MIGVVPIREALPATLELMLLATVLSAALAIVLGVVSARRPHGPADVTVTTVTHVGFATPTFLVGVLEDLLRGTPLAFDPSWPYVLSLLYLALAGTSLAFGLYLVLLKRIGAARAAYTSVLFPVVALTVSTLFEGYRWSVPAVLGLVVLVAGNALALSKRARAGVSAANPVSEKNPA